MSEGSSDPLRKIPPLAEKVAADVPVSSADDSATLEAKLFGEGLDAHEFQKRATQNEHKRSERFKDHFELIAIAVMWCIAVVLILVGMTWIYHLLLPDRWHWLNPDQIAKLQNIVTGGIITSLAGSHIKKRLGRTAD